MVSSTVDKSVLMRADVEDLLVKHQSSIVIRVERIPQILYLNSTSTSVLFTKTHNVTAQ